MKKDVQVLNSMLFAFLSILDQLRAKETLEKNRAEYGISRRARHFHI